MHSNNASSPVGSASADSPLNDTPKVLIVGSGPSGLVLALALRRNGIPVRIIEKNAEHRIGQRGAGIMPRSLELFEALGVYQDIASRATLTPPIRLYKMPEGVEVLKEFHAAPWEAPTPSVPYNNILIVGQSNTEAVLRDALSECGCEVELGVELEAFEQFDDRVNVTLLRRTAGDSGSEVLRENTSYDWVIGADGARGAVRRGLGLKLLGTEQRTEKYVVGDMELEGLEEDKWHIWGNMGNNFASLRCTEDKGVFAYIVGGEQLIPEEASSSDQAVVDALKGYMGQKTVTFGKIRWRSPYKINIRMTDTFRVGRVFLVGDSGHIHSLSGGQGMNTGVQDAFNLAWKLALVLKGVASQKLLDTYNEERVPVVATMLKITTTLLQQGFTDRDKLGWDRSDSSIKQLGVNYRWSSIVVEEKKDAHEGSQTDKASAYGADTGGAGALLAGDRAPDAPELLTVATNRALEGDTRTRLFQHFSPAKHTVLFFTSPSDCQSGLDVLKTYPADLIHAVLIVGAGQSAEVAVPTCEHSFAVVEDVKGHAQRAFQGAAQRQSAAIFVIRPDGVVGAHVGGADGLSRYFGAIFDST